MTNAYTKNSFQILEEIAQNPNIKNGIWGSLELFIEVSDDLVRRINHDNYVGCLYINMEINDLLKGIREKFSEVTKICDLGKSYVKAKSDIRKSHIFRRRISQFLKSYRGKFIKM